jgi:hypothetical protein
MATIVITIPDETIQAGGPLSKILDAAREAGATSATVTSGIPPGLTYAETYDGEGHHVR